MYINETKDWTCYIDGSIILETLQRPARENGLQFLFLWNVLLSERKQLLNSNFLEKPELKLWPLTCWNFQSLPLLVLIWLEQNQTCCGCTASRGTWTLEHWQKMSTFQRFDPQVYSESTYPSLRSSPTAHTGSEALQIFRSLYVNESNLYFKRFWKPVHILKFGCLLRLASVDTITNVLHVHLRCHP